jgi:WXG100 family type VII secretion target
MAQIKVDSRVMREKANVLSTQATSMLNLYNEMDREVSGIHNRMKGTTVDTAVQQFRGMKPTFERIRTDIEKYSAFLNQAAENYDRTEAEGTASAQQQGKPF